MHRFAILVEAGYGVVLGAIRQNGDLEVRVDGLGVAGSFVVARSSLPNNGAFSSSSSNDAREELHPLASSSSTNSIQDASFPTVFVPAEDSDGNRFIVRITNATQTAVIYLDPSMGPLRSA